MVVACGFWFVHVVSGGVMVIVGGAGGASPATDKPILAERLALVPAPGTRTRPRSFISLSAAQSLSSLSSNPPPMPSRPHSPVVLNPTVPSESTSSLSPAPPTFRLPMPATPVRGRYPLLVVGVIPSALVGFSGSTTTRWVGGSF